MNKVSKFLIVMAILSFIVIFALKMQNNMEALDYYTEKEQKAKQELELLKDAQGENDDTIINEELPMDIDKLWKVATTNDKSNLTFIEEVNLKVELLKDPTYLENIADANTTCKALKHYDKLDKEIDCKEWFLSEWEYWKALNK